MGRNYGRNYGKNYGKTNYGNYTFIELIVS